MRECQAVSYNLATILPSSLATFIMNADNEPGFWSDAKRYRRKCYLSSWCSLGQCICYMDRAGVAQGGALLWTLQYGSKAVLLFFSVFQQHACAPECSYTHVHPPLPLKKNPLSGVAHLLPLHTTVQTLESGFSLHSTSHPPSHVDN